jgi:hypothetical protein
METREEPRFIQFVKGEVVEGVLLGIERMQVGGKPAVRYTLMSDSGEMGAFIGTYQLNTKLRIEDKGHRVSILFVGEDQTVKRGENYMKLFEVKVSKERVTGQTVASAGLEITDADIPF